MWVGLEECNVKLAVWGDSIYEAWGCTLYCIGTGGVGKADMMADTLMGASKETTVTGRGPEKTLQLYGFRKKVRVSQLAPP